MPLCLKITSYQTLAFLAPVHPRLTRPPRSAVGHRTMLLCRRCLRNFQGDGVHGAVLVAIPSAVDAPALPTAGLGPGAAGGMGDAVDYAGLKKMFV